MKKMIFSPVLLIFCYVSAYSQQTVHYNLAQLLKQNKLEIQTGHEARSLDDPQKQAISATGIVWLKDVDFKEGTIDIDLRGKDVKFRSFLGIAFYGVDTTTYDALYFRPFNFRHVDTPRRKWSVEYVSIPDHNYDVLRRDHPLVYENAVDPVPKADEWFHATIVIKNGWITVYVNHSPKASLKVKMLSDRTSGKIGLWDDWLPGDFNDLAITK